MNRLHQLLMITLCLSLSSEVWAVDSYRYLHVTIDTPWAIFLFLLPIVLSPFILMAILYWRFAGSKDNTAEDVETDQKHESLTDDNVIQRNETRRNESSQAEVSRANDA
jgi:hypothetical protein